MKLLFTYKYKLHNKIQQICFTNVSKKKMQITSSKSVTKYQKCNFTHFIIPFVFFVFGPNDFAFCCFSSVLFEFSPSSGFRQCVSKLCNKFCISTREKRPNPSVILIAPFSNSPKPLTSPRKSRQQCSLVFSFALFLSLFFHFCYENLLS